jgi:hypothetical protein
LQLLQWSQSLQHPQPQECLLGLRQLLTAWTPPGITRLPSLRGARPELLAALA